MKIIEVKRKANPIPLKLTNGDMYDSVVDVLDYTNSTFDNMGRRIYRCGFINSDHTVNYSGGMLEEGNYYFIIGKHRDKYKAPLLFNSSAEFFEKIKNYSELNSKVRTMPSLSPNPNHGGKKIITYVNFHRGGLNWDWSHGCMTMVYAKGLEHYWNDFMKLFRMSEKGIFRLVNKNSAVM